MKHKITVALCIVAVALVCILSASSYAGYRQAQRVERAHINAAVAKQQAADQTKQEAFQQQLGKLEAQCSKDIATYNAQPAAVKAKTAAPDCTTKLVQ